MNQLNRLEVNPVFGPNKLKLGSFASNSTMPQMTDAPERYYPTWPRAKAIAELVNGMGMELLLAISTWRGPIWGDAAHLSNYELEPFAWAAAMGALSPHAAVIPTFHVKLMKPAFVAKAIATLDHITGGRTGLNIVAGNTEIAYAQFGENMEDPVARYEHVVEFTDVLLKFWDEVEEFDFKGKYEQVRAGASLPKPLQRPYPPIINAGSSEAGRQYIAKYADICFTHVQMDPDAWVSQFGSYKRLANDHGRHVQVWSHGYVVIGETEKDAADYLAYYADRHADRRWIEAHHGKIAAGETILRPEQLHYMSRNWAAGGGYPLVGTAQSIADTLSRLSEAGLDGMLLTALEPEAMFDRWGRAVMPLLEQAGLRQPLEAGKQPVAMAGKVA